MVETVQRVGTDLQEGILKHAKAVRMQSLQSVIADKCYAAENDLSFVQGKTCEDYMYEKDYKLNLLGSFYKDHLVRHT